VKGIGHCLIGGTVSKLLCGWTEGNSDYPVRIPPPPNQDLNPETHEYEGGLLFAVPQFDACMFYLS